ncbi:MAG: helix-turn-helix transcriptional regulator [Oscillospiraceae bacterium]
MFETLRNIRTQKGISADSMADILNLETRAAYYKKEAGSVKFTLVEAKIIADFFNKPIEEILLTMRFPYKHFKSLHLLRCFYFI